MLGCGEGEGGRGRGSQAGTSANHDGEKSGIGWSSYLVGIVWPGEPGWPGGLAWGASLGEEVLLEFWCAFIPLAENGGRRTEDRGPVCAAKLACMFQACRAEPSKISMHGLLEVTSIHRYASASERILYSEERRLIRLSNSE